jgi:hypothetical protein
MPKPFLKRLPGSGLSESPGRLQTRQSVRVGVFEQSRDGEQIRLFVCSPRRMQIRLRTTLSY